MAMACEENQLAEEEMDLSAEIATLKAKAERINLELERKVIDIDRSQRDMPVEERIAELYLASCQLESLSSSLLLSATSVSKRLRTLLSRNIAVKGLRV